MTTDLSNLNQITQLKYQHAQTAMQTVQAEENRLRDMLLDLEEKEKSGLETMAQDNTLKLTGGDIAWNNWIGRSRKILNLQLAQVMVRKASAFAALQVHFGKADVVQKLLENESLTQRKLRQMALVDSVLEGQMVAEVHASRRD